MFTKKERGGFKYTFAHWCAYQMTALNLGIWKFKYLFHDFEKPWLKLILRDYKKVQKWHRTHNAHHMEYEGKWDAEAMIIDWECSRFTKSANPMTARETYNEYIYKTYNDTPYEKRLKMEIKPVLDKLNL
jgi:hypothetical protein